MADTIDFKSEINIQLVEDTEKTIVKQFQNVTENLIQDNKELRKLLSREANTQVSTQLENNI